MTLEPYRASAPLDFLNSLKAPTNPVVTERTILESSDKATAEHLLLKLYERDSKGQKEYLAMRTLSKEGLTIELDVMEGRSTEQQSWETLSRHRAYPRLTDYALEIAEAFRSEGLSGVRALVRAEGDRIMESVSVEPPQTETIEDEGASSDLSGFSFDSRPGRSKGPAMPRSEAKIDEILGEIVDRYVTARGSTIRIGEIEDGFSLSWTSTTVLDDDCAYFRCFASKDCKGARLRAFLQEISLGLSSTDPTTQIGALNRILPYPSRFIGTYLPPSPPADLLDALLRDAESGGLGGCEEVQAPADTYRGDSNQKRVIRWNTAYGLHGRLPGLHLLEGRKAVEFHNPYLGRIHLATVEVELSHEGIGFLRFRNDLEGRVAYAIHREAGTKWDRQRHLTTVHNQLSGVLTALETGAERALIDPPTSWRRLSVRNIFPQFTDERCEAMAVADRVHTEIRERISFPRIAVRFDDARGRVLMECPMGDSQYFRMSFDSDGLSHASYHKLHPFRPGAGARDEELKRWTIGDPRPYDNPTLLATLSRVACFSWSLRNVNKIMGEANL